MKAKYLVLSFLTLLFLAPAGLNGQGVFDYVKSKKERAKDRAKDKADNKVDEKIDDGVDEVFEGIGNLFRKKSRDNDSDEDDESSNESSTNERSDNPGYSLFSGGGNAETRDQYTFDYSVKMKVRVYDDNEDPEESQMTMLYPKEGAYMGMDMSSQGGATAGIFDFENDVMITLMSERAIAIDLGKYKERMGNEMEEEGDEAGDVSIRKTGRTKMIAGYNCEEYVAEDEDFTSEMWVTDELPFNPYESFMDIQQSFEGDFSYEEIGGFPMEMKYTDKSGGERSEMEVTEVLVKSMTFDMSDYSIMNMGGFGGMDEDD